MLSLGLVLGALGRSDGDIALHEGLVLGFGGGLGALLGLDLRALRGLGALGRVVALLNEIAVRLLEVLARLAELLVDDALLLGDARLLGLGLLALALLLFLFGQSGHGLL